ncbi:hypothetical protein AAON49_12490 [Pseudotenacibaculum sp. MALMAid0570]|uniref:hypothetical protein n=1 Tax=Pseudotenacibaculum sp. MALMAid0570 TaxID=3143938 RepID=UPI0032DF5C03
MTLIELIHYFRSGGNENQFIKENSLDPESEVIEIYMQKPFSFDKEIAFFEAEKTEGKIEFEFEDSKYYNLMDFYYLHDFIEESRMEQHKNLSNIELAKIFLNYCLNDG